MLTNKNIICKESNYNIEIKTQKNQNALFNTRTGALIVFEKEHAVEILNYVKNPIDTNYRYYENLLSQGFIIDSNKDEFELLVSIHDKIIEDNQNISLTLIPAEACNMDCPYCFIYKKRNIYMKDKIFESVYNYINKSVMSREIKTINIDWFGGEPTLVYKKIIKFMNKLLELKNEYQFQIRSTIYTNGLLLTTEVFTELYNVGIKNFQITIDGNEHEHDKLRRTKDGLPTFKSIFNNMLLISKLDSAMHFKILVRANYMKDSKSSMYDLLSKFKNNLTIDNRFSIFFKPVYSYDTSKKNTDEISKSSCSFDDALKIQTELQVAVNKIKRDSNQLISILPKPIYSWCGVAKKSTHIIGADGTIFACETLSGHESSIGYIAESGDIIYNKNADKWKCNFLKSNDEYAVKCKRCKLLPICMGGCRRIRVIDDKDGCYYNIENITYMINTYLNNNY